MAKKYEFPKTVPVLEAEDFCQAKCKDYVTDKCCLIGHASRTFLRKNNPVTDDYQRLPAQVRKALRNAIEEHIGHFPLEDESWSVFHFNDSFIRTMDELAKVWNRAMAKLGYVVGNPEAA